MPERGRPISKLTADSFVWREVCEGWTLLDAPSLHVIQERMPPQTYELRHEHQQTHQLYFVLEGNATVEHADDRIEVQAGQAVDIRAGIPHKMRNDSQADLEFLVISSQRPREDRRDLE